MTNGEFQMTKEIRMTKDEAADALLDEVWSFDIRYSFVIWNLAFVIPT